MKAGLDRFVDLLLFAYPEDARRRYGDEIASTAIERVERAYRDEGARRAGRLLARESAGIISAGTTIRLRERRRARRERRPKMPFLDSLWHDLRIAARGLARRPAFTLVAVAALALGIGAAIAIFSVFHAVLLSPLPFAEPHRLVSIWEKNPERDWYQAQAAAANFLDWRESASSFEDMAAYNDWFDERVLLADGEPRIVLANEVTGTFFDVLGVRPTLGRSFEDAHTWDGVEPATVLSYGFWNRQYGGDPGILEQTIELDGTAHRVIGVMPEGFRYPFKDTDLWVPVAWQLERREQVSFRRAHGMRVIGRLADGVTIEQAEAEIAAIAARLEEEYPETNTQMGTGVTPLQEWIVGDATRPLQILMAAVLFLLLVACANVSNMLLARTNGRAEELKIRSALGGARRRLVREGLLESSLLAVVGGILGLALGTATIRPLLLLSPTNLPRMEEITVDSSVVVFAIGLILVTGLVFGAAPAWRGATLALSPAGGARGASAGRKSRRATAVLVAAEVALTLPLVVGAGLMVRTLAHLSEVEPGFVAEDVVVAKVMAPPSRYESDRQISDFFRTYLEEVASIPGVDAAAMSTRLPFGNQRWSSDFTTEGWPADRFGMGVRHDEITPGLFRTMGVPLLRGRDFETADDLDSVPVVIINQALADAYFPDEDPIGKRITFSRVPDADSTWRTIVGVVGNVRREALSLQEQPSFYAPVLQDTSRQLHVLVRSQRPAESLLASMQERLRALDPTLPLFDATTLESELAGSVARERFLLVLLTIAAVVALLLASIGIFGVVSYSTSQRVREIGIRMALGAEARSVVALILGGGLRPVLVGAVLGVFAAAALARTMSSLLFEVQPLDVPTFLGVLLLVLVAAILACAVPARRATRVDATTALRSE